MLLNECAGGLNYEQKDHNIIAHLTQYFHLNSHLRVAVYIWQIYYYDYTLYRYKNC